MRSKARARGRTVLRAGWNACRVAGFPPRHAGCQQRRLSGSSPRRRARAAHAACPGWSTTSSPARSPWLDALFVPASWLGSIAVLLPAAFALWLWRRHRAAAHVALFPLLAVGGAWLFVHSAKLLVARPRPDLFAPLVAMPQDLSFPSAHTAQAGAFAIAVVLISSRQRARGVIAAASLLVATVALSRLYLQVHYPSDVLAGLIVGAGWTAGLWLLLGRTR
jgi:membrane-associated phospholipid phosphatase